MNGNLTINGSLNLVTNASTHSGGGLKLGVYKSDAQCINLSSCINLPGIIISHYTGNLNNKNTDIVLPIPSSNYEGQIIFIDCSWNNNVTDLYLYVNSVGWVGNGVPAYFLNAEGEPKDHLKNDRDYRDNAFFLICIQHRHYQYNHNNDVDNKRYVWKEYWCNLEGVDN